MSKVPLLLSDPIPLPVAFAGDWAGAGVVFDLARVQEWEWEHQAITAACKTAQTGLDARRATLPPPTDTSPEAGAVRATLNADQRALNRRWVAIWCAHLVYGFVGGTDLPATPQSPDVWETYPQTVNRWIQTEGYKVAMAQVLSPFLPPAADSSTSTAA